MTVRRLLAKACRKALVAVMAAGVVAGTLAMRRPTHSIPKATARKRGQDLVNELFDAEVQRWNDMYEGEDIFDRVIQHRLALTLRWVDRLGLAPGSPVLEVGCGAGHLAVPLAQRGLEVCAVDSSAKMIQRTLTRVQNEGQERLVRMAVEDVQSLAVEDESFDLVIALGVIDWVPSPQRAMGEIARVLRPGGSLIFSCGHPGALAYFIEPLTNVLLTPAVRAAKSTVEFFRLRKPKPHQNLYSFRFLNRLLSSAGLTRFDSCTVGFGPITVLRCRILPNALGMRINNLLQERADDGMRLIRSFGMGYMVLAHKPTAEEI